MKRIFLLKGLDCPNCSAKIEKEVGELIWDDNEKNQTVKIRKVFPINVYETKNHKKAVTKLIEIGAELKAVAHKYL